MHEELHLGEWIRTHLLADTGAGGLFDPAGSEIPSGVYRDPIPLDKPLPAVRFVPLHNSDVRGATDASARIVVDIHMLVCYVREGHGIAALLPKVDRIDTLLHGAFGSTSTLTVYKVVRLEPFNLVEVQDSGESYRHVGGIYRMQVQAK